MKKLLVAVATFAASVGIGLSAGVSPAKASPTCQVGTYYAGGGTASTIIPDGSSYSVHIGLLSYAINNGGAVAGWAGVNQGTYNWLQAGIYATASGPTLYIEFKPAGQPDTFPWTGPAALGVNYTVTITHFLSGYWSAKVGNSPVVTEPVSAQTFQVQNENQNLGTVCNDSSFYFSQSSLSTNQLGGLYSNPPYNIYNQQLYSWYAGDILPPCQGCQ